MQRHELLELLKKLKLHGMVGTFDETVTPTPRFTFWGFWSFLNCSVNPKIESGGAG
jgi:hypothetical protein